MPFLSNNSRLAVNAGVIAAGQVEAPSLPLDHKKPPGLEQTSVAARCADAAPLGSSDAAQSRASLLTQPSQRERYIYIFIYLYIFNFWKLLLVMQQISRRMYA